MPGSNCTRRSPKRSKPIFPRSQKPSPSFSRSITPRPVWSKRLSPFWGKAGHRSVARSAMAEAAAQFQKGLDQLALLPDIPERRRKELELSSALGAVLNIVKVSAAPETGQAYARARELWEQL